MCKSTGVDSELYSYMHDVSLREPEALMRVREAESFDLAFIDADKENYVLYFELSLQLM